MRTIGAALLATTMLVSSAFAATGPLASGKPAGVQQAQMQGTTLLWVAGVAVVAGGIALVASGNGNNTVSTSTTGTNP